MSTIINQGRSKNRAAKGEVPAKGVVSQKKIAEISKRDGSIVPFEPEKIEMASHHEVNGTKETIGVPFDWLRNSFMVRSFYAPSSGQLHGKTVSP